MKMKNWYLPAAALAAGLMAGSPAKAQTTYTNVDGPVSIYINSFGSSSRFDVPILGQVFIAPTGSLLSWTFYNDSQATTGAIFGIAAWTGTAGPSLFNAASNVVAADPDNIGYFSHTVSGIGLALTAGQAYYAYYTTDNAPAPVSGVSFEGADASPLGRYAAFSSNTNSPAGAAYNTFTQSLVYSATFAAEAETGAVPEPASWAMMIVGFGVIGVGQRRRAGRTARHACA